MQATREATPQVASAFDQALASANAQRGALGVPGSNPQAEAFTRRVGEQKANALVDLTSRQTRATEGRVFANETARSEYLGGKQKIQGQLLDLAEREGDQTAATLGTLEDKARSDETTRRGQTLSHQDRVRSNEIAARTRGRGRKRPRRR